MELIIIALIAVEVVLVRRLSLPLLSNLLTSILTAAPLTGHDT